MLLAVVPATTDAQLLQYPDPSLDAIFPAGAQQGQSVEIELLGLNGLKGATGLVIDGPPGVTAASFTGVDAGRATATLNVDANAAPGRRRIRVLGGANGLTNWRSFFVGTLPEMVETEPTGDGGTDAEEVTLPVVINARLSPSLDVDHFRFEGRKGQNIVAAMLAHGMDTLTRQGSSRGYLDANLSLSNERGDVCGWSSDELGLDPVLAVTLPDDGFYTLQVQSDSFQGYPQAVYRLTLGEIPYPIAMFPPGGQRGSTIDVEFVGLNLAPGTRRPINLSTHRHALQDVTLDMTGAEHTLLPFLLGDFPEINEPAGNNSPATALPLELPLTVNGRFDGPGESDWYRLPLEQGDGILLQTASQRHLRTPVDTEIQVIDADGAVVARNDDGRPFANECLHDFASQDSYLPFTAAKSGDYHIVIRDLAGQAGPGSVYRLTVEPRLPDFRLFQWPDAVPVWGAGTTSAFVVQLLAAGGLNSDVSLHIEGLPSGWTGSVGHIPSASFSSYNDSEYGVKALLTITAPPDASPGDLAAFRVVGRAEQDGRVIEHQAQALSLLGNSHNDRMHLRYSPESYAVVAPSMGMRLDSGVTELTVTQGETVSIPVTIHFDGPAPSSLSLNVDGQTVAASCAWRSPFPVVEGSSEVQLPLEVSKERPPGRYRIVISRAWSSDLRGGRPGPCTPLIELNVLPSAE